MLLVKMITDDDGAKHTSKDWHLVINIDATNRTVCTGECFGEGEGSAEYKVKTTGKITCRRCIEIVKWYKAVKL